MPVQITTEEFGGFDDFRWIATEEGVKDNLSATIYAASVLADFPTGMLGLERGVVPSGLVVAKITSGPGLGKWGPFNPTATDGRQTTVDLGFLFGGAALCDKNGTGYDTQIAIMQRGVVYEDFLPVLAAGPGFMNAAAKTALSNHFLFRLRGAL